MADTVENSIEAVVGTAAPAEGKAEGIDQAITPAPARDTAARAHAGPATKSVPVKKNAGRTNQVGPQRDVAAKAATPRNRCARPGPWPLPHRPGRRLRRKHSNQNHVPPPPQDGPRPQPARNPVS